MHKRIYIKDLKDHVGSSVTIAGWVDVRRDHGKLIFVDLRDATGMVQMVALPHYAEVHETAQTLRPEWVISVTGIVNKRPEKMVKEGLNGDVEVEVTNIEVLGKAKELPFEMGTEINIDTYLDYLPLALRTER